MIIFLLVSYMAFLFLLVKLNLLTWSLPVKLSPVVVYVILLFALFIPLQWSAPSGPFRILRHSVQIVPNVTGQVIEVNVIANKHVKRGDVLYRIETRPFEAAFKQAQAQLQLAKTRFKQYQSLYKRNATSLFKLQEAEAKVLNHEGALENARYNLEQTVVRAPGNGFATNIALRKGARVASFPMSATLAFIDTSETIVGAQIHQNYVRYIRPGQKAEVTLKVNPGVVYNATVEELIRANSDGQVQISGLAPTPQAFNPGPFIVRIRLDKSEIADRLPAGSVGTVAIYTESAKPTHLIRRVMLRMQAWINYIIPF